MGLKHKLVTSLSLPLSKQWKDLYDLSIDREMDQNLWLRKFCFLLFPIWDLISEAIHWLICLSCCILLLIAEWYISPNLLRAWLTNSKNSSYAWLIYLWKWFQQMMLPLCSTDLFWPFMWLYWTIHSWSTFHVLLVSSTFLALLKPCFHLTGYVYHLSLLYAMFKRVYRSLFCVSSSQLLIKPIYSESSPHLLFTSLNSLPFRSYWNTTSALTLQLFVLPKALVFHAHLSFWWHCLSNQPLPPELIVCVWIRSLL